MATSGEAVTAPAADGATAEAARLRLERDLYRRLLSFGADESVEDLLARALDAVVEVSGAEQGYIELRSAAARGARDDRLSLAHGYSRGEIDRVRGLLSSGIIAHALERGETVTTVSAELDPRFAARESVRRNRITAVLCAPIGAAPPVGVLYLQGRRGGGAFTSLDRERVELVAATIAPAAVRLLHAAAREAPDPTAPYRERMRADALVGRSAALAATLREASLLAALDVAVFLTGPSGTGKTALARILHASGPRAGGPFQEINCAAIPAALFESELFGASAGAHSTAHTAREGLLRAAHGGTLLLDEVTEMPPEAQAKLLLFLQDRTFRPLGSDRTVRVDVRVIAASNRDVQEAVRAGRFREDLFFRLFLVPLRMPPLAERREDIPPLVEHFAAEVCRRHGFPRIPFTADAVRFLECAEWPGNVRQLANVVERSLIRVRGLGGREVNRTDLVVDTAAPATDVPRRATLAEATRDFQREMVRSALRAQSGNIAETARALGLSRSRLYELMHELGIHRDEERGDR